jgi:hypothetical protein
MTAIPDANAKLIWRKKMTQAPASILAIQANGSKLQGEILVALADLVNSGTVRVIDAVAVKKDAAGNIAAQEVNQLGTDELRIFNPLNAQVTGLLSNEDISEIAESLDNGSAAGLLVLEHVWATKLAQAIQNADGRVVMNQLIMPEVLNANLEAIESVTE